MFKKLVELIKDALRKMIAYDNVEQTLDVDTILISEEMQSAIDLWRDLYKDEAPWLSDADGIYSLGLGKVICQLMQLTVLSEMKSSISEPDQPPEQIEDEIVDNLKTRASYLNYIYQKRLVNKLPEQLEKGMAMGGMIIKPYMSNNDIFFDFTVQGDFLPLEFDDDGNITDVAFVDQFVSISSGYQYTKIERQTFKDNTITIVNKAFKSPLKQESDSDDDTQSLGLEINLSSVSRWSSISQEPVVIKNVSRPLYGYYKVPLSNNVDMHSPLGMSIFAPAVKTIERADQQFSRLDWEYNGGQIAIDVDVTATNPTDGYYGKHIEMDSVKNRLYRRLDLGQEDTYQAFAPVLRDNSYRAGLNSYLNRIEDQCGLARGTLGDTTAEARTATEISIVKQRSYVTASSNQDSLELAIRDAIRAANVYIDLYELAPDGKYVLNIEWQDNILTDTRTELEERLELKREGILGAAEIRAWFTGEDIEVAKSVIKELDQESQDKMLNDIFTKQQENTLEDDGEQDKEKEAPDQPKQNNTGNEE